MAYSSRMMTRVPGEKEMLRATMARDRSYDGIFYVCVRTTGIFCRPSCPSRKPNRRNVVYHSTVRDCLLDGFRACKRCRPLATNGRTPEWLDSLLLHVERSPGERWTDKALAGRGFGPHRVRRYFTENFGMSFQAYQRNRRMGMALEQLRNGKDSIVVALDHGYESHSGFRDAFERVFGATPGRSKALNCLQTMRLDTPIGPMVAAATAEGVCLLEFADRRALEKELAFLRDRFSAAMVPGRNRHLDALRTQLEEYFTGSRREFSVSLISPGTPFQERVWNALGRIGFGKTQSYAQLARTIGRTGAQRAVGRANGDNRLAILIPCHRVVRDDGTLCGYGGGLWRKQFLLDLEREVIQKSRTTTAAHV